MPRHVAIDANQIGGTVRFEKAKTVEVTFLDSKGNQVYFTLAPRIKVIPLDVSAQAPFKVASKKTGSFYTGFTLGFGVKVTMDVEWEASERA